MAPAQVLVDQKQQRIMEAPMKSVAERENENFIEISDDVDLRCTNNCEDNAFDIDILPHQHEVYEAGDPIVDIVDCADASARVSQDEDPDATEYSSSFGNTMSGSDNGLNSNLSDADVESSFHCDNGDSISFDGLGRVFRPSKKRLTTHWKKYIRPVMWRCKWIELRMNECQSQALKYDKKLAAYSQRKPHNLRQAGSENSAARLVSLSCRNDRKQVMKRKRRKRLEDTSDLSSYMSQHNLFSYYEKKKSEVDGNSIDDECGNQVVQDANTVNEFEVNYEWPVPESIVSDDSLEQILWNIEVLQSRVLKINAEIAKLVSKNACKFSSMDNSDQLMSADQPSGTARSPAFSPAHVDGMPVGAWYTPPGHISEHGIGDLVMQESSVSSFGEATSLPDIIESTVGLLSSVDVPLEQPQNGDYCADIDGDVLIQNPAAEGELQHFENVNQHINEVQDPTKEQEEKECAECPVAAPEQDPTSEPEPETVPGTNTVMATEQPVLRACLGSEINVPRNKRKRAGRRGSLRLWNANKVYSRRFTARKR